MRLCVTLLNFSIYGIFSFFHYIRKISESSSNTLNGWRPLTVYKYASKAQDGSTQLRLHLSERKSTQYFQQLMFIPTVHSETYVDKIPSIAEQFCQLEIQQASMENSQTRWYRHHTACTLGTCTLPGWGGSPSSIPFPGTHLSCSFCIRDLPKGSLLSSSCELPLLSSHLYIQDVDTSSYFLAHKLSTSLPLKDRSLSSST